MKCKFTAGMLLAVVAVLLSPLAPRIAADDGPAMLTVDHYVRVRSTVPAMAGQTAQIYVREKLQAGAILRSASAANRVVLFVHGAGTPAEVAFDAPYQDYSWMAHLAKAGFDVFSMDATGYGPSTRPTAMNDPCNLSREQQAALIPTLLPSSCPPSYPRQMTTIASDWNDIGAVVEYIRALRHVERVSLVAWSLGGPRAAGYTAQHPEHVQSLVLLAPAYTRAMSGNPPADVPAEGVAMNTQSREEFNVNWDRQLGCADQYDPAMSESVWQEMLQSDPVGATWGTGVRRAPLVTTWGWNAAVVGKTQTPMLLVAGEHDKQVVPQRVRELYEDLGARQKVFVEMACSSHNAMWEKNHLMLFRASVEWLSRGSVNGKREGMLRLGYPETDGTK